MPPKVRAELESLYHDRRLTPGERMLVEEDVKLRFLYGGLLVVATPTPDGLLIHAVGLTNPDEIHALRTRLRREGYRTILNLYPSPWEERDVQVLTPGPVS